MAFINRNSPTTVTEHPTMTIARRNYQVVLDGRVDTYDVYETMNRYTWLADQGRIARDSHRFNMEVFERIRFDGWNPDVCFFEVESITGVKRRVGGKSFFAQYGVRIPDAHFMLPGPAPDFGMEPAMEAWVAAGHLDAAVEAVEDMNIHPLIDLTED